MKIYREVGSLYIVNRKDAEGYERPVYEIEVDEAEPIRHGHWVDDGQRFSNGQCAIYECDQCGETIWVYLKDRRRWNYCPNCGAKMSEEVYIKLERKEEVKDEQTKMH